MKFDTRPYDLALRGLSDLFDNKGASLDDFQTMLKNFYRSGIDQGEKLGRAKFWIGCTVGWWACAIAFWTIRALS